MLIHISKLQTGPLARNTRYGLQRLNRTVRQYANQPHPNKPVNTGSIYTIGAFTSVIVGTLAYAKYDENFREWINENVPAADGFMSFVFQEKKTYGQQYDQLVEEMKRYFSGGVSSADKKERLLQGDAKNYTPPRAAFTSLLENDNKDDKFNEIREQSKTGIAIVADKPKETIQEKPKPIASENAPKNIASLEVKIGDAARHAIEGYSKAASAFRFYNREVETIIEESVEKLGPQMWNKLKEKTDQKNEILADAESTAKDMMKDLERFRCLIDEPSFEASETAKSTAKRNIDRFITDIRKAREDYDKDKQLCNITEKYWRKVFDARCHFIEELEILFPNFDINKKKLSLKPSDLDLFVVHAFKHVLHYQKELQKLEVLTQVKLKQAVEAARKGDPDFEIKEVMIREEIDKEKRKLADEFHKKCLAQRKESERELRHRLKCQEQAHIDHLADVLTIREAELERNFHRKMDEKVSEEHSKYKTQMAGMVARMTGMKNAITERMEADKLAHQSQVLWSACQALYRSVKNSVPGMPYSEQIRPLKCEIDAIKLAAADSDELVSTVLNAIPEEALKRGVFPEGALRERFIKVERAARRLALVPQEGAQLPLYLLSFIQATLLSSASNPIPQEELDDKPQDFGKLNTYDILQRARYWIDRGNYAQTLKYMNLLKGASRCIATEWMKEARILLETQQAAETLMAHAVASGLLHL